MRQVKSRFGNALFSVLLAIAVGLAGCAVSQDNAIPAWEDYLAAATTEFDGQPLYMIEGDIAVSLEELRRTYDELVAQEESDRLGLGTHASNSTVNVVGWWWWAHDDIWPPDQARDLRYCVSDEFGALKGRAVAEMATATSDWMRYGNFTFIYDPTHDANCTNANRNVRFSVRPTTGDSCAPFPSGLGCPSLLMNLNDSGSLGTFRHELGHVLGLQHEHIRAPSERCRKGEGGNWRALTRYDRRSVMHYDCEATNDQSNLVITASDAAGIQQLYGPSTVQYPLPWIDDQPGAVCVRVADGAPCENSRPINIRNRQGFGGIVRDHR